LANKTSAKPLVSNGFREKKDALKVHLLNSLFTGLNPTTLKQWDQRAQTLLMKMRNAEFYLKGATAISLSGSRLKHD